jgi:hypothetical protein
VSGTVESYQFFGTHGLAVVVLGDGTRIAARLVDGRRPTQGEAVAVACQGEARCFPAETPEHEQPRALGSKA